ncbi:MAG TPA: hypothetical protein VJT31_29435 [Rugosimonospora sp.]|nr:hypothetical protein [Rugosimonospora sp.]
MGVLLLVMLLVIGAMALFAGRRGATAQQEQALADARADAQRWYERLGGQLVNLQGDAPAARQALSDAAERYQAAGGQLARAGTVVQYQLVRESALEGLAYVRAAREALGLDPGPDLPAPASARGADTIAEEREVVLRGQTYRAGPRASAETPYYYPGGWVGGRPVPAGWYSTPWWKTALAAGAGALGGMLIFDALFGHGHHGPFGGGPFGGGFGGGGFGGGPF